MSLFNLHNNTMKYSHLLSFVCELEALETLLENQSTSHEHLLGFRILTVPQSYQLESLPRLVRLRALPCLGSLVRSLPGGGYQQEMKHSPPISPSHPPVLAQDRGWQAVPLIQSTEHTR